MSTWPIPDGLDAARAACVPVAFGTAQECLFTAGNLEAGQTALIHAGAGGVGMAAIQLAKQAGATVIATASSDEKLERLKEFGLDHGINYASESFVERTRELTDGRGADVILDSVGGQNLVDSIGALAYRGTLVSVGVAGRAGSNVEARDLWAQNNTLRGVFLGGALLTEYPRVHAMIADLLERVAERRAARRDRPDVPARRGRRRARVHREPPGLRSRRDDAVDRPRLGVSFAPPLREQESSLLLRARCGRRHPALRRRPRRTRSRSTRRDLLLRRGERSPAPCPRSRSLPGCRRARALVGGRQRVRSPGPASAHFSSCG